MAANPIAPAQKRRRENCWNFSGRALSTIQMDSAVMVVAPCRITSSRGWQWWSMEPKPLEAPTFCRENGILRRHDGWLIVCHGMSRLCRAASHAQRSNTPHISHL